METETPPRLLTCRAAADRVGITERAMRHLFDTRAVPLVRLGSRLYVTETGLAHYIAQQTLASAS